MNGNQGLNFSDLAPAGETQVWCVQLSFEMQLMRVRSQTQYQTIYEYDDFRKPPQSGGNFCVNGEVLSQDT